jgi:hypothetical protein
MGGLMAAEWSTTKVLREIQDERQQQDHPDGTGPKVLNPVYGSFRLREAAHEARTRTQAKASAGKQTWMHILAEEVFEALCEEDQARLREELIQIALVAVCWVECIDRREAQEA